MREEWIRLINHLPLRDSESWEGGLFRLPVWVEDDLGQRFRPWAGIWGSTRTGCVQTSRPVAADQCEPDLLLEALIELIQDPDHGGYVPRALHLSEQDLVDELAGHLKGTPIAVSLVSSTPVISRFLEKFAQEGEVADHRPSALGASGVDVERMRSFADAARIFYDREPWKGLTDHELIRIDAPAAIDELRYCVVMGAAGIGRGLFFFSSPEQHALIRSGGSLESLGACWMVTFSDLTDQPALDADLWEDNDFPVSGPEAYPMVLRASAEEEPSRPDGQTLEFIEGVLRALAAMREEELAAGELTRIVHTHSGACGYTFVRI